MGEEKNFFSSGNIPVLTVQGKTLPEVWENSLVKVWKEGVAIRTQYDRENDLPSRDSSMVMVFLEPFSEPRIHRAFPTGLDELEIYRQEVVLGVRDYRIGASGWSYTYHSRFFDYPGKETFVNQIKIVVDNLANCYFTRRAQAITWNPETDATNDEPPCLQRLWFRILKDPEGDLMLNMNSHWRSRDAFKAAFMNIFAITELQRSIAEMVSEKIKKPVKPGRYADMVDSYHIYGKDFIQFEGFLKTLEKRTFEQRTYTTQQAEEFFKEGKEKIKKEIEEKEKSEKLFTLKNPV